MSNELAIYNQLESIKGAAVALHASGFFSDVKNQAQAIVKVMAGAELGLPPFASMSGIHIVQGKPVLGSNVIATLVKNDPRYDYHIKQADNTACIIEWFENGKPQGESSFTLAEASKISSKENGQNIKLSEKATWRFYTSDMLFARAISRGARRFAPGIFGGAPVYTPDEMNIDTDEDGYIVEVVEVKPEPQPEPEQEQPQPTSAIEEGIVKLRRFAYNAGEANEKQRALLRHLIDDVVFQDDNAHHVLFRYLYQEPSIKAISGGAVRGLLDWLKAEKDASGEYQTARGKELHAVMRYIEKENGQLDLFESAGDPA